MKILSSVTILVAATVASSERRRMVRQCTQGTQTTASTPGPADTHLAVDFPQGVKPSLASVW